MNELKQAYDEGYSCGMAGGLGDNPYDARSKKGREWKRGVQAAINDSLLNAEYERRQLDEPPAFDTEPVRMKLIRADCGHFEYINKTQQFTIGVSRWGFSEGQTAELCHLCVLGLDYEPESD